MKICITLASALLATIGCLSTASAALIVSDNFDGYADQAAFQVAWPAIGTVAPQSAELSTAQASSSPNSVRVPAALTGQHRNRRSVAESGAINLTDKLIWSFDFYDSAPTTSPQRNYSNLQDTTAPSLTNQLIAMGFNNNQSGGNSGGQFYMARILGYTVSTSPDPDGGPAESGTLGAGAFFKLNDFGVGTRSLGWHNLKVVLSTNDGLSTDYAFYVDNVLAEKVSNIGTAASIRSYDNIVLGSGVSNGSTEAFFDNVRLAMVPEPGTALLAGLFSGLAACAWRRRAA